MMLAALLAANVAANAIRIDSCQGECDRTNKALGTWHTDIVALPPGVQCTPHFAVSFAIDWLAIERPGFHWAGSVCVRVVGQET